MIHKAAIKIKVVIGEPSPPPPPPPPFVGSRLRLRINSDGQTVTFRQFDLADDSEAVTADWGDGTVERCSETLEHTYAQQGEYEIRLSDDIYGLAFNYSDKRDDSTLSFISNATRLEELSQCCFHGCLNLAELDVRESGVNSIVRGCFEGCKSLTGELYFPRVESIGGTATTLPFLNCTGGITKIHFAEANEAAITNSQPYLVDPTLGTGTAICVFDL